MAVETATTMAAVTAVTAVTPLPRTYPHTVLATVDNNVVCDTIVPVVPIVYACHPAVVIGAPMGDIPMASEPKPILHHIIDEAAKSQLAISNEISEYAMGLIAEAKKAAEAARCASPIIMDWSEECSECSDCLSDFCGEYCEGLCGGFCDGPPRPW